MATRTKKKLNEITVTMPNEIEKKAWVKCEVDDPRESQEAVKNVYIRKDVFERLEGEGEIELVIRRKKETE